MAKLAARGIYLAAFALANGYLLAICGHPVGESLNCRRLAKIRLLVYIDWL